MKTITTLLVLTIITINSYCGKVETEQVFDYGAFKMVLHLKLKVDDSKKFKNLLTDIEISMSQYYFDVYNSRAFKTPYTFENYGNDEAELTGILTEQFVHYTTELGIEVKKVVKSGLYIDSKYELNEEKKYKTRTAIAVGLMGALMILSLSN